MRQYDVEKIRAGADIRSLAGGFVELKRESAQELSGPCPKCDGTDRFHCQSSWFFCRKCHPDRGDAIEFMKWLHGCGFKEACEMLGAHSNTEPLPHQSKAAKVKEDAKWQSQRWQDEARREMEAGIFRLSTSDGEKGREYLASRGFRPETYEAWKLGYVPNLQRSRKVDGVWAKEDSGPAITIPWTDDKRLKALQYRLLTPDHPKKRYRLKTGSDRTLFGVHLLAGREILLICEGELNAVSFWQVGHYTVDVVSFGPQDNIDHASPFMNKLAGRYRHVLVWADEPEKAVKALLVVGGRARAAISPRGKDANDLLQEGVLADVFENIIANAFGPRDGSQPSSRHHITLVYPAEAFPVTIAGKWTRLDDGRIEASYTRVELIWAMAATGYEPTADEMARIAES